MLIESKEELPVSWEVENCIAAGHYLRSKLWPLGDVELVGSAKKGKAYYRLHDIDIVLQTKIDDIEFLTEKICEFIKPDWEKTCEIDLDVFCYGNFKRQIIRKPLGEKTKITIHFNDPRYRIWEYLRTITYKSLQSLLKKLRGENNTSLSTWPL